MTEDPWFSFNAFYVACVLVHGGFLGGKKNGFKKKLDSLADRLSTLFPYCGEKTTARQ